ncbi:hypothetical protein Fcan01_04135 [Folsomia candida]|uniref:Uncharacterized protein n=1 Tax=Folsomia candida TaxID=158441 RepID=A0A226EQ74_FOLCA|nr:hypothetical protein Fcan01_04135 [Folsomia candida]
MLSPQFLYITLIFIFSMIRQTLQDHQEIGPPPPIIVTIFIPPTTPPPPPPENFVLSRSCDDHEQVECSDLTFLRFGCCPKNWEIYDDWRTHPIKDEFHPAEFCNPSLPLGESNCNQTLTHYGLERTMCAPVHAMSPIIGRCRRIDTGRKAHQHLSIYDRKPWSARFHSRLGKPCNLELYKRKKIQQLWDHLLKCPFDHDFLDDELSKTLEEALFSPKLLDDLCLSSPNMEECVEDDDESKLTPHLPDVHPSRTPTQPTHAGEPTNVTNYQQDQGDPITIASAKNTTENYGMKDILSLKYGRKGRCRCVKRDQIAEGKTCGQAVGNPCTFDVIDIYHDSPAGFGSGKHGFYDTCQVKGANVTGMKVLDALRCERDAACEK